MKESIYYTFTFKHLPTNNSKSFALLRRSVSTDRKVEDKYEIYFSEIFTKMFFRHEWIWSNYEMDDTHGDMIDRFYSLW